MSHELLPKLQGELRSLRSRIEREQTTIDDATAEAVALSVEWHLDRGDPNRWRSLRAPAAARIDHPGRAYTIARRARLLQPGQLDQPRKFLSPERTAPVRAALAEWPTFS